MLKVAFSDRTGEWMSALSIQHSPGRSGSAIKQERNEKAFTQEKKTKLSRFAGDMVVT